MLVWNLLAFILLCSAQRVSGCSWIQHGFRQASRESLKLLNEMGGNFIEDNVPVPFPNRLYKTASKAQADDDKLAFLSETFDHIMQLFNGNLDAVTWNRQKLGHFLDVLYRQSHELHKCVPTTRKHDVRLSQYFKKLKKNVLKQRQFDSHSWELVRTVVRRHLQRLDLISASIEAKMD